MNSHTSLVRYAISILGKMNGDERNETIAALETLAGGLREGSIRTAFLSPALTVEQKMEVLQKAGFPHFAALNHFWIYVFGEHLTARLERIVTSIKDGLAKAAGETVGVVRSAVPLTESQKQELARKMIALTGSKSVHMREEIVPERLAGLTIEANGMVMEGSFQEKLERIGRAF